MKQHNRPSPPACSKFDATSGAGSGSGSGGGGGGDDSSSSGDSGSGGGAAASGKLSLGRRGGARQEPLELPGQAAAAGAAGAAGAAQAGGGGGGGTGGVDLVDVEGATIKSWQYIVASPLLLKGPEARQGLKDWVDLLADSHPVDRWVACSL